MGQTHKSYFQKSARLHKPRKHRAPTPPESARPTTHHGVLWRQSRWSRFWIQPWDSMKLKLLKCWRILTSTFFSATILRCSQCTPCLHGESLSSVNSATPTRRLWLRHQHDLADVLSSFDIAMCCRNLIERESAIHVRLNPTFMNSADDLLRDRKSTRLNSSH